MSPDIAIVTALYDDYDTVKPVRPQLGADVEWVLVTDRVPEAEAARGWTVVHEPKPGVHPNRAAKGAKFAPWRYTSAPASVWVDASFRVISQGFALDALTYADPIAQFIHPWRDCIYAEAAASAAIPKYAGEPVAAQADHYQALGHPAHWGLWATGVIARKHTARVADLGDRWTECVDAWSFQDQISQPHALRITGLRPAALPGTHFANPWLVYEGSGRH